MTTVSGAPSQIVVQMEEGPQQIVVRMVGIQGAPGAAGSSGTTGSPGSAWRNGTGAPSNTLGIDGDYYLDDGKGDIYYKAAGAYTVVATIEGAPGVGVPPGGSTGQVLSKINGTDYNTQWVPQTGGGGFIQTQRPVSTGSSDGVLTTDGNIMILWNSAAAGVKTQTIPDSCGSLQIIMIVDVFGNSGGGNPINIITESGDPVADIATGGNTLTLIDSELGWIVQ